MTYSKGLAEPSTNIIAPHYPRFDSVDGMNTRPPAQRASIHFILASGLFSGCFSKAPGTIGSLACLIVWLLGAHLGFGHSPPEAIAAVIAVAALGLWSTKRCLAELAQNGEGATDPQFIVIDEWAGLLIPLALATPTEPLEWFGALALFRAFDILKPWPVSAAEGLPGAWGVMADDLVAGGLAAAVLYGGIRLFA